MSHTKSRRALFAALLLLGVSGGVAAATPSSTGLGEAWPNAVDVSLNPHFHAYVFVLGGVQYIQINDLNGNVLGSVGTAGGQYMVLPVGKFAQFVTTPQQSATTASAAAPTAAPTTVYDDDTTAVSATPLSDGSIQLSVHSNLACEPTDPATCGTHGP